MTDPIADMLTRIRNAQAVRKSQVLVPYSKLKHNLAKILYEQGYLKEVATSQVDQKAMLVLVLKYAVNGEATIHSLKRISKPGRRMYANKQELPYVLNDFGVAIISTSHGLMTNRQARKQNLGGEIICEVY
jgi:small subunit ribosomal protein S8